MALSNIFNEPRREITESVVGIVAVAAYVYADYRFGSWMESIHGYDWCPCFIGMIFGGYLTILAIVLAALTHAIGDAICNVLQRRGIHLRPRQGYGR